MNLFRWLKRRRPSTRVTADGRPNGAEDIGPPLSPKTIANIRAAFDAVQRIPLPNAVRFVVSHVDDGKLSIGYSGNDEHQALLAWEAYHDSGLVGEFHFADSRHPQGRGHFTRGAA